MRLILCCLLLYLASSRPMLAQADSLAAMSLEQLMEIEVTIVSRRPQPLSRAAAAVYVLSADDIRSAGVRSLPDALRLVPGLQVARIDASKWSVSARGFGGQFANKLHVLIDGRSVYTPLFGGVFWDVQDLFIQDIERVEIIRGPGAALWGANAVNGIINVITKNSSDTRGGLFVVSAGLERRTEVAGAHGGSLTGNPATTYRVYGKYFDQPAGTDSSGIRAMDDQQMWRGGLRLDHERDDDSWMLQTGVYAGEAGQTQLEAAASLTPPYSRTFASVSDLSGGHVLGRWTHRNAALSETILQVYLDRTKRMDPADIRETRDTGDIDFQHRFPVGTRQDLVWGLGYRLTRDDIEPTFFLDVDDTRRTDQLFSFFLHDELAVHPELLRLTLGVKLERNSYTGLESQPNARLVWTPSPLHTLWSSMSRAVRTPARGESGQSITVGIAAPGELIVDGVPTRTEIENADPVDPDELIAFEIGWRTQPLDRLSIDAVAFRNRYDDIMSFEFGAPYRDGVDQPYTVLPLHLNNDMQGHTMGVELLVDWRATNRWRLRNGYSFLDKQIDNPNPRLARDVEMGDPRHQFTHWSTLNLPSEVDANVTMRFVDDVPTQAVDAYLDLDVRLGWCPSDHLCLSAGGRNLLQGIRREYTSGFQNVLPTNEDRVLYFNAAWTFGARR